MVTGAEMATFWGMAGLTVSMAIIAFGNWRLCQEARQNRAESEVTMLREVRLANAKREEAEQKSRELAKQLKLLKSARAESIKEAIQEGRAIERKAIEEEQEHESRERQKAAIAETCGKAMKRKKVSE